MRKQFGIVVIAIGTILSGCAHRVPKFETDAGLVQWHKVNNLSEMQQVCNNKGSGMAYGCYQMDNDNNICHIYAMDRPLYFDVLGHELKHCFDGRFHSQFGDSKYPIDKQNN